MLSLEAADKFFWTVFDFVVHRPRRFHELRSEDPNRYMNPLGFTIVNFVLFETILVAAIKILNQYWDLTYVTLAAIRQPEGLDLPGILAATGAGTIFVFVVTAGWIKLAAFVVRRKASLKDIIIGICYATAFNGVVAAALGFGIFIGVTTGSILPREQANVAGRIFYIGYQIINLGGFGYFIASAAALTKISFTRLLLGTILVPIILFAIVIGITIVIALMAK